jgi:hypothetical protein
MEKRKQKTRFGLSEYRRPTPIKWRRVGDGLLLASTLVSTTNIESPVLATASIIIGTVGKFLTNFFAD